MIQVRKLGTSDVQTALGVAALFKTSGVNLRIGDTEMSRFLGRSENLLLVAQEDNETVGFLLAYVLDRIDNTRPMVLLYELEVVESHRRRGVGMRLLESLKAECQLIQAIKVWTITDRTNEEACGLYQKAGGHSDPGAREAVYEFSEAWFKAGE